MEFEDVTYFACRVRSASEGFRSNLYSLDPMRHKIQNRITITGDMKMAARSKFTTNLDHGDAPTNVTPAKKPPLKQSPAQALLYQPGISPGTVDVAGIIPQDVRIDPDITEGHPGYDESGSSELHPPG
jgi:hypothetical protein